MPLPSGYIGPLVITTQRGRQRRMTGIRHQSFVDVVATDDNGYLTTVAGPNTATDTPTLDGALVNSDGVGVPDYPRNVIVTVTHATSIVALSGTISGYDINGQAISEAWSVTATGTSKTYATKQAFARVSEVTITAAADASGDSVIVGTGKVLGLDTICDSLTLLSELEDAAAPGTGGTLVAGGDVATPADRFGTYTPNSDPDGSKDFDVWYLSDYPETSD